MSQWLDSLTNHSVWQHLQALGPVLDEGASREGIDADGMDHIARTRAILAFVGKRLASVDPALVNTTALDSLSSVFQKVQSEVQAFVSNGQPGHLNNASTNALAALAALGSIPAPSAPDDLTSLSEAASSYRADVQRSVDQGKRVVADLVAQASQLEQRLEALAGEVTAERARLTSLTSEFQGQFSAAQENRSKEFVETQARLVALTSELQGQFSTAQESRSREFTEAQTARAARFSELHTSYTQKLAEQDAAFSQQRTEVVRQIEQNLGELRTGFRTDAAATLEQIEQHKLDVEKLVGVIGNLGVTSGYLKAADHAKRLTWLWQALTVFGLGLVITFAFFAFLPAIQSEFSWEKFAGRVVLTLAVGVFAAYSSAQADRYMESERRNRRLALELEALGPYLAPLPEDKQQEFRLAIGDRTFGREEPRLSKRDRSPATLSDVLLKDRDLLRDVIVNVLKSGRP